MEGAIDGLMDKKRMDAHLDGQLDPQIDKSLFTAGFFLAFWCRNGILGSLSGLLPAWALPVWSFPVQWQEYMEGPVGKLVKNLVLPPNKWWIWSIGNPCLIFRSCFFAGSATRQETWTFSTKKNHIMLFGLSSCLLWHWEPPSTSPANAFITWHYWSTHVIEGIWFDIAWFYILCTSKNWNGLITHLLCFYMFLHPHLTSRWCQELVWDSGRVPDAQPGAPNRSLRHRTQGPCSSPSVGTWGSWSPKMLSRRECFNTSTLSATRSGHPME